MVVVGFMIAAKAKYNKLNCYLSCGSTPTNIHYKASSSYVWLSGSVAVVVVVAGFTDHDHTLHNAHGIAQYTTYIPSHP